MNNYCITIIINGKYNNHYFEDLVIGQIIYINGIKFRIKAIGVRIRQQPCTKELYFDLNVNHITCIQLTKRTNMRLVSFKFIKIQQK